MHEGRSVGNRCGMVTPPSGARILATEAEIDRIRQQVEEEVATLLVRAEVDAAATLALRAYGRGVLGYLVAIVGDEDDAAEVFSSFSEDLWKGMRGFRRECSVKTWAYKIAWHAAMRFLKSPRRRRVRRLRTSEASKIAAEIRSASSARVREEQIDRFAELRTKLEPDEHTLLVLRVDRHLSWKEVATVMSSDGSPIDDSVLRKRFERLKQRLHALARESGISAR